MSLTSERLDPRIKRTRHAIQEAFQVLLSEHGLIPLTVQDITAQAGVNRATFYAHYRDKHDLFARLIQDHLDATLAQRLTRPLRFGADELRGLLLAVCTFMTQVHESCHVHDDEMEVQIERQVQGRLEELLLEGLEGCVQVPNSRIISRQATAMLTASSLYAAAAAWGRSETDRPLEAYVAEMMVFVLGGVSGCGFNPLQLPSVQVSPKTAKRV